MPDYKEQSWADLVHFTDKQKEASREANRNKYTLFGGSAGPGKSYWLRWYAIEKLIRWYNQTDQRGIHAGLFSEDYPSLKDRQIIKIQYEFPLWLGELKESSLEGLGFFLRQEYGGGVLSLRNLDDPSKYLSAEYSLIAIDELTRNKKDIFNILRTRLRWPGIQDTKFIAATNPGGPGHEWVKKIWIDKQFDENEVEQDQFVYVKALPTDNPHLDPSYLRNLQSLPDQMRKAYLEGDWNVFEGQFFSEWSEKVHVIQPFPIPDSWRKYRAYDHGRDHPAVCLWLALDHDGRVYVYRELYRRGKNIDELAKEIIEMSQGEEYQYSIADNAIFAKTGFVDRWGGETIAESFARNNIMFYPSSKRRIDGWALMHQYLSYTDTKLPKLQFFSNCANSIRSIPTLIFDYKNPEDLDTRGQDDCFTGDTLVDTFWGKRKIKDLVGKEVYVMTSNGFQKCRSVRKTRNFEVWEVFLSNGIKFKSTPDHRFYTDKGWKELKNIDIRYDALIQLDICITSYLKLFKNLTAKGIISAVSIFKEMVRVCMLLFGSIITEKFHEVSIYTTKMETNGIIASKTSDYFREAIISPFTCRVRKEKKEAENVLQNMRVRKQSHGISLKQEESGTANTQKNWRNIGNGLKKIVLFVKKNIRPPKDFLGNRNTAIKIAKLQPCGKEEVYDLSVPSTENFTIHNGILVHNCADALRYFLQSLHEISAPKPKSELELKIEKMQGGQFNLNEFYYG